jgi:hypothetical protein
VIVRASGRFFEKKLRKKLLLLVPQAPTRHCEPAQPAWQSIFRTACTKDGLLSFARNDVKMARTQTYRKFFAELFFKKATACFGVAP